MRLINRRYFTAGILLCLLILTTSLVAQDEVEFGVFPMSGPDGVLLVIHGPSLHPDAASANSGWIGYHLYRKADGDTGFVRITTTPVSRVGSLVEFEKFAGGPIDGLERFVGLASKEELWQRLIANDSSVMILGVFSRTFYEALGLLRWDRAVEKGKKYTYRATRVNNAGRESTPSEAVEAVFGTPPFKLAGPLDLKATNINSGIELTWAGNPEDSGGMAYNVYRTPDLEGSFLRINRYSLVLTPDSATGEQRGRYLDSTASQGRTYHYAVVSSDYAGNESDRTNIVSIHIADLQAPPIPQNVFADPHEMGITITWDKVDDPEIGGYFIYRSLDPDSNYQKITEALLPYDTGWYVDKSATASDRVFYRVSAVDRSGNESPQSARALSLYENYVVPLPPQEVRVTHADNGVKIIWRRNEEPDLQGYYVFRADSYGGELTQISPLIPPDTVTYVDTSRYLSPRGEYWYLLQAVNHTGLTSHFSVPIAISPSGSEQPEPVLAFWGYYDNGAARLFWRTSDDNMVAGYNIYRTGQSDSLNWINLTANPLARMVSEFKDTTISPNSRYSYRITSINHDGTESGRSHTVEFGTFETVAPAPGGLRVTSANNQPQLLWDQPQLAEISGYRVYRRQDNTETTLLTAQPVATASAQFTDTSAKRGVKYYYSIASVDTWGRESERSTEVEYLVR